MSKSLGNSPDPLDVINEYGADALRFTIVYLAPLGQDVLYSNEKVEIGRNFANKIWNAGRLLLLNAKQIPFDHELAYEHLDIVDRWILSRLHKTIDGVNRALEEFDINGAAHILYDFIWHDYCDWYLELMKERLYSARAHQESHGVEDDKLRTAVLSRAIVIFETILRLLHPFMPFITEELWHYLPLRSAGGEEESIMIAQYPVSDKGFINDIAETEMELAQEVISSIRTLRSELNIAPTVRCAAALRPSTPDEAELLAATADYIRRLARLDSLTIGTQIVRPKPSVSGVAKGVEVFLSLANIVDIEAERRRIEKELERISTQLEDIDKKLNNPNFLERAPAEIVEREKEKQRSFSEMLAKLRLHLEELEN